MAKMNYGSSSGMDDGSINRQAIAPLAVPRSLRQDGKRALTSFKAGKVTPLVAIPLLREDAVRNGTISVTVEMQETAQLLMNLVNLRVQVWCVPYLAFDRFQGSMDVLNKSYKGVAPLTGDTVIDFIQTAQFAPGGVQSEIYKALGLHAAANTTLVNTAYAEAYNLIWNFRAENRSPDIAKRLMTDQTLAPAFWYHSAFKEIVPDFDQAIIDGEVALNVVNSQMPVMGIGLNATVAPTPLGTFHVKGADGADIPGPGLMFGNQASGMAVSASSTVAGAIPQIYAELADNGITVSLSTIEQARKTQAFARLREQFVGQDELIIDMLMSGLQVPDQALKQPMMIGSKDMPFVQNKRYATDSGNLMDSAVNGATQLNFNVRFPRLATGGILMVTAEVTPEQLFERKKDMFFHKTQGQGYTAFPDYLRDELDTEKVVEVTNDFVDVLHTNPTTVFGYAPLNHEYNDIDYMIGGKFLRPDTGTANDEDRQRLWAVETANPVLGTDFYVATNINQKPFLDTAADAFECVTSALFLIEGNTVLGQPLIEAENNYQAVLDVAPGPDEQIVKP